jgi:hypothetical protein
MVLNFCQRAGLAAGLEFIAGPPEPLLNKDIKVQVSKQKPNPVRTGSSPDEAQQR